MHGHDGDLLVVGRGIVVHHQRDMFEEIAQRLIFLHRTGEFAEVFDPPLGLGGFLRLEHGVVAGVVERRQTLPILSNILLRHNGKELTLTGTDLEVEITARLADQRGATGEMTVPARKLYDICRALPAEAEIEISLEKEKALVRSGTMDIVVVDSVAALVPRAEIEGEMGDSHPGLQARLMSQALRKMSGVIKQTNTTVMLCSVAKRFKTTPIS